MTKNSLRLMLLILGLTAAFDAAAAETAGRVLVAVGDVVAVRNGKSIHLDAGATVESGDSLRTGAASNAQVRMTDGGILALRPSTELNIDTYHFNGQQDGSEKNFVSLIKGGFRTITGLIGKAHRDNYQVKAPTATIGIRGTDYTLLICSKATSLECLDVNGRQAQDGLYGSVSDGRINVANRGGDQDFSRSESFFVADANTAPQQLIAPPNFLADRLEGQERNRDRSDKDDARIAQLSLDTSTPPQTQLNPPPPSLNTRPFIVTETTNAAGISSVLPPKPPIVTIPAVVTPTIPIPPWVGPGPGRRPGPPPPIWL